MKQFETIHHVDSSTIDKFYQEYAPVFVLSTGRTGTKFIVELLNHSPNIEAFHEPIPTLERFVDQIYKNEGNNTELEKIFDTNRLELILNSYIKGKIYVESNQCITFLAYQIAKLYPKAKFIHLIRHPGDFVRSALMKGWYANDTIWEVGRIKQNNEATWNRMDQKQKLAWLWNETNSYIEKFSESLDKNRLMVVRAEDLFSDVTLVKNLLQFIDATPIDSTAVEDIQGKKINELIIGADEPQNMKKVAEFPSFFLWPEKDKKVVNVKVRKLAEKHNYDMEQRELFIESVLKIKNNQIAEYRKSLETAEEQLTISSTRISDLEKDLVKMDNEIQSLLFIARDLEEEAAQLLRSSEIKSKELSDKFELKNKELTDINKELTDKSRELTGEFETKYKKLSDELILVYASKRYKVGYYLTSPFRMFR